MKPLALSLSRVIRPGASWYRGDFHSHTYHSDGALSPEELLAAARAAGLEFLAITDHNTASAYPHFPPDSSVLVIPGVELTTDLGHFNIFGLQHHSEWMSRFLTGIETVELGEDSATLSALMSQTAGEGLLNSLNHPFLQPWDWRDGATELAHVHCIEVWNDPNWPGNERANPQSIAYWTELLNQGFQITAIGGSDYHGIRSPERGDPPEQLGLPATYVYADELSGRALLQGVRRGRVYLSAGPTIGLYAQVGDRRYDIGAELEHWPEDSLLHASISEAPAGARALLIGNSGVLAEFRAGNGQLEVRHPLRPVQSGISWVRLDLLDRSGALLSISNPIRLHRLQPPLRTFGEYLDLPDKGMVQ